MTDAAAQAVADARDALLELPGVHAVSITEWSERATHHQRALEVTLNEGYHRAPPRVLRALTQHDLGIADVSPQGDRLVVAAV